MKREGTTFYVWRVLNSKIAPTLGEKFLLVLVLAFSRIYITRLLLNNFLHTRLYNTRIYTRLDYINNNNNILVITYNTRKEIINYLF